MKHPTGTNTADLKKKYAAGSAGKWFLLLCLCAALLPVVPALRQTPADSAQAASAFPGWPSHFQGRPLTALPLSALEQQFQKDFPGKLGRFSDGRQEIILRWVNQGSRRLHSAADCFRANGHVLQPQPMSRHGKERWSRFIARHGQTRLMVSERIVDNHGQQWSDVSAWYWATQLGQTTGPWWAVTVASNLEQAATAVP